MNDVSVYSTLDAAIASFALAKMEGREDDATGHLFRIYGYREKAPAYFVMTRRGRLFTRWYEIQSSPRIRTDHELRMMNILIDALYVSAIGEGA